MIGSRSTIEKIEELLGEIAHKNNQNYGHILDLTDMDLTRIFLGKVKDSGEVEQRVWFDVICGIIWNEDDDTTRLKYYDYFSLTEDFEERMSRKLNEILEALNKVTAEEKETIKTLEKVLDEI